MGWGAGRSAHPLDAREHLPSRRWHSRPSVPGAQGVAAVNATERLHRFEAPLMSLAAQLAPEFERRRRQLTVLNLFRALPYTQVEAERGFLLSRMRALIAAYGPGSGA